MWTWSRLLCLLLGHRSHAFLLPALGAAGEHCRRCGRIEFCDCAECRGRIRALKKTGRAGEGDPMLVWEKCGRGLWRSACGRFDLMETGPVDERYFVALDGDAGRVYRSYDRAACEQWCAARAGASS